MIETVRYDNGEILDNEGRRLKETAEMFRANQRLQHDRVKDTKKPLAETHEAVGKLLQFRRNQELIEAGKAPHDAHVATQEEVEAKRAEYERTLAAQREQSRAHGMAVSHYREGLYEAHQHFIANGGNQGPYVDAAVEDANAEMERRGEPPVKRSPETPTDIIDRIGSGDWSDLGSQYVIASDWLRDDPTSGTHLHDVGAFLDKVSADFVLQGKKTPDEARELAISAAQGVIAARLLEEAGGIVDPSFRHTPQRQSA